MGLAEDRETVRAYLERAPQRWICASCEKTFPHKLDRQGHTHRQGGRRCYGELRPYRLVPEQLVRWLARRAGIEIHLD